MSNAVLEISISNILKNLEYIKNQNENKEICIPLKANAYGLGYELVDYLLESGYNFYGVSTIDEALYIRKRSKDAKILLFSAIFEEDIPTVIKNNITITVYDIEMLKLLTREVKFHLKFDLGMGRLGFNQNSIKEIKGILELKALEVQGIYTHLPKACDESISQKQIANFEAIVKEFEKFNLKYIHIYNGVGALKYKTTFDNLVRPGLITYGYLESKKIKEEIGSFILPSVTLKVKVSLTKPYQGPISYDGVDQVAGEILTIPLGYHDGLKQPYRGYNISEVGKIVGKICMCQTMILQKEGVKFKKGQYINLIRGDDLYSLSEYSKVSVYEILATLGNRIQRKYI